MPNSVSRILLRSLYKLPTPVQVLLADEIKAAHNLIEEGEDPNDLGEKSKLRGNYVGIPDCDINEEIGHQHVGGLT